MPDGIIYLDHHATTPLDPRVLERMLPYLRDRFGNAASRNHAFGWEAEAAVEAARAEVAALIGGTPREIVFTSGATEANNLAILGVAEAQGAEPGARRHLITQATEHKAVLDPAAHLGKRGWEVTVLPVDASGGVDPEAVRQALRPDTALVSIMLVNNEIGTIQPLAEIGRICRQAGVLLHTDATQGVGKVPIDVEALGVALLSLSGHKLYGPKGVGALYLRRRDPRVSLAPQVHGGGHERGLRSGTVNVPGVVGLGEACRIARAELAEENERVRRLRDRLEQGIRARVDGITVHGHPERRHPGNLNVAFRGVDSEALILGMRDVAVSSGAACASATLEPSHVLRAIGCPPEVAHASVRFSVGRFNTEQEIDRVIDRVGDGVGRVRALSA